MPTGVAAFEESVWYLSSNFIYRYRFKTRRDGTYISGGFSFLRSLKVVHPFKQPGEGMVWP